MQFEELIKRVVLLLEQDQIPYMLLGGQAVLRYGKPRLTEDIDITLGILPSEASKLLKLLNDSQLKPLVDEAEKFLQETFVLPVRDNTTGIRIDFIFSLSEYERLAISRGNKFDLDGIMVNYISVEDLIIHKLIASRPRDLEDLRYLFLKNPDFDKNYVKQWLKEYDQELDLNLTEVFNSILQNLK